MKLRFVFGSKSNKLATPSPVKDKNNTVNGDTTAVPEPQLKSQCSLAPDVTSFRDFGSKEESFFDSQPWLESDCEDDFVSVNGDSTPTRGNAPVHHLAGNLTGNRAPASDLESPQTDKKKRLSELFKESLSVNHDLNEQNAEDYQNGTSTKEETALAGVQLPPKSTPGTPYSSLCGSERTPNGALKSGVKSSKSAQCCLPRLLSSRSFSERGKKMSPARCVG